jgi:hypothetical protein
MSVQIECLFCQRFVLSFYLLIALINHGFLVFKPDLAIVIVVLIIEIVVYIKKLHFFGLQLLSVSVIHIFFSVEFSMIFVEDFVQLFVRIAIIGWVCNVLLITKMFHLFLILILRLNLSLILLVLKRCKKRRYFKFSVWVIFFLKVLYFVWRMHTLSMFRQ